MVDFHGDVSDEEDLENKLSYHPAESSHVSKILLILICLVTLLKTFFFLRIFKKLSYLVTMMRTVIYDLRIFMVFYLILLWMCSLIFTILEVGFYKRQSSASLRNVLNSISYPGQEYRNIPEPFW